MKPVSPGGFARKNYKKVDGRPAMFASAAVEGCEKVGSWSGNRIFEDFSAKTLVTPDGETAIRVAVEGYNHAWRLDGPQARQVVDAPYDNHWTRTLPCGPDLLQLVGPPGSARWHRRSGDTLTELSFGEHLTPVASPDGSRLLLHETSPVFRTQHPDTDLWIGDFDDQLHLKLQGPVMAACFSPDGRAAFVLVRQADAASSLLRIETATGAVETLAADLDTPPYPPASVRIAASSSHVYFPAAGNRAPDDEARQRPVTARFTHVYRLDLAAGVIELVVSGHSDLADISLAGDRLFWVRSICDRAVVALPFDGGEAHQVVHGGYIPEWHPDGDRLSYTMGQFRLADWAMCLDTFETTIDTAARPISEPVAVIEGSHEDFTHVFSPCGRWIAYHTHRGVGFPIPYYDAPDNHDAIFVRAADDPDAQEYEVSRNGWEIFGPKWSPDGRAIYYQSWNREGHMGIYELFAIGFDPETGEAAPPRKLDMPEGLISPCMMDIATDGRTMVVEDAYFPGLRALWIVDLETGQGRNIHAFASHTYAGVAFARDAGSIVFAGLDERERMALHAISVDGGEPRKLSDDAYNLMHPTISPDGKWIAATRHLTVQELWSAKVVA